MLVVLGTGGCAAKNPDMLHFLPERQHSVSAIEYRVGIPDTITITAPRVPEINGEIQRMQPDGKINLRLLGQVKVVGMTAKEIAAKLEVLLSKYYVDPKVAVKVASYRSKKYYVYGEGVPAGPHPFTGRDTLLDAVVGAVPSFLTWTSRVKVVRPSRGDVPVRTITVDVDRMLRTGDWSQNILLEPDDVVYIPPTPLAWFANRVREVFFPVRPAVQAYVAPAYLRDLDDAYDAENQNQFRINAGYYPGYGGF